MDDKPSKTFKIIIICFINDPFDQPGGKRIGGGHLVLKELGEYLVSMGEDVTFITRLNSEEKNEYTEFGPLSRIFRIPIGPRTEIAPSQVGTMIDELENATLKIMNEHIQNAKVIHSQYWIAGEVSRRINATLRLKHIHYMLSFGRQKQRRGEQQGISDKIRDLSEIKVFEAATVLIAQCPSEALDLLTFYPEINHKRIKIIPHGIDPETFSPQM